jgi:capsular polysaccharide export protein
MPGVLFVDNSANHAEFLGRLADRLTQQGRPSWLAAIRPRERRFQRLVSDRLLPEGGVAEIERHSATVLPDFLSEERESAIIDEAIRSTLAIVAARGGVNRDWLRARFRRLVSWFVEMIRRHDLDVMFLWNGLSLSERAAAEAARAAGIALLYAENGFFPKTMQIDPLGVNVAATITDLPGEFFDSYVPRPGAWDELLREMASPPRRTVETRNFSEEGTRISRVVDGACWRLAGGVMNFARRYPERPFVGPFDGTILRSRRLDAARRRDAEQPTPPLPDRYVFVPLQVRADTQILEYSPHVKSMPELVGLAVEAARAIDPELRVVVKEHPKDLLAYEAEEREFVERDGVVWLRRGDLAAILRGAQAVVTINSTVGMEALSWGRPVVTLGCAFYNKAGLVEHAATPAELNDRLRAALGGSLDAERTRRFLCYVRDEWLVRAGARWLDDESLSNAAAAIVERAATR